MIINYSLEEHKHNFSVWAAARATQRSFTTVENLRNALEQSGIREFLQDPVSKNTTSPMYHELHSKYCNSIMDYLTKLNIDGVTFGRAAKLIAIYLKSMIVNCDEHCSLSINAYPPIDSILLKNISKDIKLPKELRKKCEKIKWTFLDEVKYNNLINDLKTYVIFDQPMWYIEKYWTVTN